MRITLHCRSWGLLRQFVVVVVAALLWQAVSQTASAQCMRGGGVAAGGGPRGGGGVAAPGVATAANVAQLQQLAALARQQAMIQQQRRLAARARQQSFAQTRQRTANALSAELATIPREPQRSLTVALERRAAYLRTRSQRGEGAQPKLVALVDR